MGSLNKAALIGHLGANPESRFMPDGTQVANISIATTESWKDKQGDKRERTEWHRVVFYAGLADVVCKYLEKGAQVYVEGKLRTRNWEDKQGVERFSTEVVGKELVMLGKKNERYVDSDPGVPDDPNGIPF